MKDILLDGNDVLARNAASRSRADTRDETSKCLSQRCWTTGNISCEHRGCERAACPWIVSSKVVLISSQTISILSRPCSNPTSML
eukprot:2837385-Amphidinium_carterae.2